MSGALLLMRLRLDFNVGDLLGLLLGMRIKVIDTI
jgi:hypothetical protein